MPDNKENAPFEEDDLRRALSESLHDTPLAKPTDSDSGDQSTELPYGEEAIIPGEEDSSLHSLLAEEKLHYEDMAEAWQEDETDDRYFTEEEEDNAKEENLTEDEQIYSDSNDEPNMAPPSAAEATGKADNSSGSGISQIVIAVIVLSAIGFTASNWMANQKIDALTARLESIETLVNANSLQQREPTAQETEQSTSDSDRANEAMLMQFSAQIVENREAIKALEQSITQTSTNKASVRSSTDAARPAITSKVSSQTSSPAADKPGKQESRAAKKVTNEKKAASANQGPGWNVVLMSLKNEKMANQELATLKGKGVQAEKHTVKVKGEIYHQLRVGWFKQKDEALLHIKNVVKDLGYKDAWVRRTD